VIQLRALGFSVRELKESGHGAADLKRIFEVVEKRTRGVVKALKELGFEDEELEEAGFTRRAVEAINGSRSVPELKDGGGYDVGELRQYGLDAADLRGIYTLKDIREGGYGLDELREGGIPEHAVLAVDGRPVR